MKTNLKNSLKALALAPALVLAFSFFAPLVGQTNIVMAERVTEGLQGGAKAAHDETTPTNLLTGDNPIFKTVVNVLLFVIGAVAVIMLIYGGIRYVISGGDANAVSAAKNTILYAVVGIIVAILAYAVVNFVIENFTAQT